MPDAPGFAGIEGQHVALLTTRAALSLFSAGRAGRGGGVQWPAQQRR